jgi:hypothetical protein
MQDQDKSKEMPEQLPVPRIKRPYIKKIIKVNQTADRCKYQREYLKVRPEKRKEYQAAYYTKVLARMKKTMEESICIKQEIIEIV